MRPSALLAAAYLAHAAGSTAAGVRLALRAFESMGDLAPQRQWSIVPWAYPPAFDSLLRQRAAAAGHPALDAPLLAALIWQESKFDPRARSRSDALGLTQMKHGTALDVARWYRLPAIPDSLLYEPTTSTRYGSLYLARMLRMFDGNRVAALAGYNAGPGRVSARWRELAKRGGDALFCELIVFPETEDYVKRIVGLRAAYRELAPRPAGP
jgi:soluble lytic murein transglycosylase